MNERISKSVRRVDAVEKAGGYTRYMADIPINGLFYGKLIRTTVSRGRITSLHVPKMPKDYQFISVSDIPSGGENRIHMITSDWPVFTNGEVRYYGQTIGILVGPDREKLYDLAEEISVEYREEQPALTIEEGLACLGGAIHGEDNLFADIFLEKGTVASAFEQADRIIEDVVETGFQEHVYLEPQGVTAEYRDGKLSIRASCQCPFYIRKAVQPCTALDIEDIIVEQVTTGGAFGGKEHFPDIIASALAVAALAVKQPVQVIFERREDMLWTPKRHPSQMIFRTALDKENRILAMDIDGRINAGAFESCSSIVLQRSIFSANSVYDISNVRIRGRAVATNTVPSDAFRGFGAPQGIFAAEMHMSHLAREAGIEESEFKRSYLITKGGTTVTNGTIHEEVMMEPMWKKVSEEAAYYEKRSSFPRGSFRGIGSSWYFHGGGFTGSGEQQIINSRVWMRGFADGKAEILLSNVEMGQGVATTFRKIASHVLGIPIDNVIFHNPSTDRVPDSGPTVASRSIMIVGKLVERAAQMLSDRWDGRSDQEVEAVYEHPPWAKWDQKTLQGDAYPSFSWGICIVEVAVDPITYEVETLGAWAIHEIGRAIDEAIVHGQVSGGVIQALGYGGLEKLELKDGMFYQHTLSDYIIPTSLDFPSVKSYLMDNPYEYGPFGAKGLGEVVFDGAAAAYAEAVQYAIDRKVEKIPVTPEYIMELLTHG